MLRKLIAGTAVAIVMGAPAAAAAQPPSPPEIVHKVDRGIRHAFTNLDRTIHRTGRRNTRTVRRHTLRAKRTVHRQTHVVRHRTRAALR
jgi:hypothetical protein